jgi:hypothetical protein
MPRDRPVSFDTRYQFSPYVRNASTSLVYVGLSMVREGIVGHRISYVTIGQGEVPPPCHHRRMKTA